MKKVFTTEKISSVLVEGGSRTLGIFAGHDYYDECLVFIAPKIVGDGLSAVLFEHGIEKMQDAIVLKDTEVLTLGDNVMIRGFNQNVYWIN